MIFCIFSCVFLPVLLLHQRPRVSMSKFRNITALFGVGNGYIRSEKNSRAVRGMHICIPLQVPAVQNYLPKKQKQGLTFVAACAIMQKLSANAAIAQPVERILGKDEVASSNLASSSKTKAHPSGWAFVLEQQADLNTQGQKCKQICQQLYISSNSDFSSCLYTGCRGAFHMRPFGEAAIRQVSGGYGIRPYNFSSSNYSR